MSMDVSTEKFAIWNRQISVLFFFAENLSTPCTMAMGTAGPFVHFNIVLM